MIPGDPKIAYPCRACGGGVVSDTTGLSWRCAGCGVEVPIGVIVEWLVARSQEYHDKLRTARATLSGIVDAAEALHIDRRVHRSALRALAATQAEDL